VVDVITADKDDIESTRKNVNAVLPPESFCFDIEGINSALQNNLTNNFNYLGWACAVIVFLFLWFSYRNIKLAMLTFLPMTISWIWILGIMALLGIQFNLVNVILATFIFGQGDDYTIFVTEGCLYEQKHGSKMLASHKRSIALSALIMFIGIGSLIFAKHPALHSLAEITIVGMLSVVLMAYVIPPLLFRTLSIEH
jgi:predicted RND superfamily exporter protein